MPSERPSINCRDRLALTAIAACFPEALRRRWDAAYVKGIRDAAQLLIPEAFDESRCGSETNHPAILAFVRIMARIKSRDGQMPTEEEAFAIREILALKDSLGIPDNQFCEKGTEYLALARRVLAAYDGQS